MRAPELAPLVGRDAVLAEIRRYLAQDHNVLLIGPRDVGKTAIIRALALHGVLLLDPFMGVTPRAAGAIRRAMDRGVQCLAAARSTDRAELGAVRRLVFRFTSVRVPPLPRRWMRQLLAAELARQELDCDAAAPAWMSEVVRLSHGLPGLGVAIIRAAAELRARTGHLPSPRTALVNADIGRVELYASGLQLGSRRPVLRHADVPGSAAPRRDP